MCFVPERKRVLGLGKGLYFLSHVERMYDKGAYSNKKDYTGSDSEDPVFSVHVHNVPSFFLLCNVFVAFCRICDLTLVSIHLQ